MKPMRFFFKYAPGYVAVAIAVGVLGGIASAALMAVINAHLSGAPASAWTSGFTFAALAFMVMVTNYVSRVLMAYLSQRTVFDLRMNLSRRVAEAELRDLEKTGVNRVMAALTHDIEDIARAFLSIPVLCIDIAVVVACFIYMGWLSLSVLAFSIVFLVLAVASSRIPEAKAEKTLTGAREDWDALVKYFSALTGGIKELKLHAQRRGSFFSGYLQATAESYYRKRFKGEHIYAVTRGWQQIIYFLFVGLILYVVARPGAIDLRMLVGFIVTALFMKTNVDRIQDVMPLMAQSRVALKKIAELGLPLERINISESNSAQASYLFPGSPIPQASIDRIELTGIVHTYYHEREDGEFRLGPIDMTISAGELIFIVGGNGSGKTTLAKLLTGLYAPEMGEIQLDGRSIGVDQREWYRQHFTGVFSDFYLFDTLLGLEKPNRNLDTKASEYLRMLQLDHKVRVNNGVLSNTDLSQGQRKRLALLTAYLEDRPIYVFDEWAADQDPAFKDVFYLRLLPELRAKGKTVVVITHDDRYYGIADRVLKLDYGRLLAEEVYSPRPVQLGMS